MTHRISWVLSFCLFACSPSAPAAEAEPEAQVPAHAERWIHVESAAQSPMLQFSARWMRDPSQHAEVSVPVAVHVREVHVQAGSRVEAGALLATLGVPSLVEAKSGLAAALLRIHAYQERLDRLELLASEGLSRGADLAEMRMRVAEASAEKERANGQIRALESGGLVLRGDHAEMRAPLAGTVTVVNATLGSTLDPSDGVIFDIAAAHSDRIESRIPFELSNEMRAQAFRDNGEAIALTLVAQSPEVGVSDGMRASWFAASPATGTAGSTLTLRVSVDSSWIVSRQSIVATGPRTHVRTKDHGDVVVTIVAAMGESVLVRGDLREGDFVAITREAL